MNPLDDLLDAEGAHAADAIALITELVAAVTWLRRGAMPGLTVSDAVEQALSRHLQIPSDWRSGDPLRSVLGAAVQANIESQFSSIASNALRSWLDATGSTFNEAVRWA